MNREDVCFQNKKTLFKLFWFSFLVVFVLFSLIILGNNKGASYQLSDNKNPEEIQSTSEEKLIRKKRTSDDETVGCHITRHDEVYKQLWESLFKVVLPWLKAKKITKIWVLTNTSVQPYLHQQFDVSAFNYHGVEEYETWAAIPNQVKCTWFNKYPNEFSKNPWLSSPFATLRGLKFYLGILASPNYTKYSYLTLYKYWKVTKILGLNISYFLNLSNEEIFQSLTTHKYFIVNSDGDSAKNFLYNLGFFFLSQEELGFNFSWLIEQHSNEQKLLSSSYNWQKFNLKMWTVLKRQLSKEIQYLNLFFVTHSLFWELNHYQVNEINDFSFVNLNKESRTAISFYDLSKNAREELLKLITITSSSDMNKFKQPLKDLLKPVKTKLFWKIIRSFLPKLKEYKVTTWKEVDLKPLLLESSSQDFASLKSPAQAVINQLIDKFYPLIPSPPKKIVSLEQLHQYDSYQEITQLNEQLNNLLISKSGVQSCLAITDFRYKKWWEEVFYPLVPKLVEHKVTQVYYGVRNANFSNSSKWQQGDWLSTDGLFFNISAHNYYGAKVYSSYEQLPNEIKCQLPNFLFHPKRIKTLKSLKIYTDILLPRLIQYQKHSFASYGWHYVHQFNINELLAKTEKEIFDFIKEKFWGSPKWQISFIYLGVLDIDAKTSLDYKQAVDDHFARSQFWLDSRIFWKKMAQDQFLTTWKGSDITGLKKQADTNFYYQLIPTNQDTLETLMQTTPSPLLITKIIALAEHLSQLESLWTELQALQSDLKKYQIHQLEEVDFSSLRANLSALNPQELPAQARQELISLMEISDLVPKLKEHLVSLQEEESSDNKTLIILLSVLLPLVGSVVGGGLYFWRRKKNKSKKTN